MVKWARDVGHEIMLEEWHNAWANTNKFTIAQEPKENLMKMHNRWYYTPWKIKKNLRLRKWELLEMWT